MSKPRISSYSSTQFRMPGAQERKFGLWVDRIGRREGERRGENPSGWSRGFRKLGLYGVVAVLRGDGEMQTASMRRPDTARAGDVIFIHPSDGCRYRARRSWDTCWIVWNGPEAEALETMGGCSARSAVLHDCAHAVEFAWHRLNALMIREDLAALIERKQVLLGLFRTVLLSACTGCRAGDESIVTAVRILQRDYGKAVRIQDLASEAGMSASQFRRRFKAMTGQSPRQFLTAVRLSRAKEYLSSGMPIKQVAMETGFADEFHFMKAFRKGTGTTAGAFLRAAR